MGIGIGLGIGIGMRAGGLPSSLPIASFTWTPTSISIDDLVSFTDRSSGVPTSWLWEVKTPTINWATFSTSRNPTLVLDESGDWEIRLTASNAYGDSAPVIETLSVSSGNSLNYSQSNNSQYLILLEV